VNIDRRIPLCNSSASTYSAGALFLSFPLSFSFSLSLAKFVAAALRRSWHKSERTTSRKAFSYVCRIEVGFDASGSPLTRSAGYHPPPTRSFHPPFTVPFVLFRATAARVPLLHVTFAGWMIIYACSIHRRREKLFLSTPPFVYPLRSLVATLQGRTCISKLMKYCISFRIYILKGRCKIILFMEIFINIVMFHIEIWKEICGLTRLLRWQINLCVGRWINF